MHAFVTISAAIYLGIALREGRRVAVRSLVLLPLGGLVAFGVNALIY